MKFKDPFIPIDERVEDLLSQMTLKEKVGQLNQKMYGLHAYTKTISGIELTDAFKEEVNFGDGIGAIYGLFRSDPWSAVTYKNGIPTEENAKVSNDVQRYIIENTRLGIPVLLSEECPHGHQALDGTMIPTNLGAGSTWNPELMEEAYGHIASEIRSRGAHLGLISTLDILRDPRWGRSEECFSEDPFLAAKMTTAAVYGLQGRAHQRSTHKIAAILKHFAAQGAGERGLNAGPVAIGERELREIHLPGMKAGVAAGAYGCMAAYNEIDGIPCHANETLLTDILRGEWGFEGIVMADGTANDRLNLLTGSYEKAGALALKAGVDLSLWDLSFTKLADAVNSGVVEEGYIDRAVRRVLKLKFSLGLFENPYTDEGQLKEVITNNAFKAVNVQVARESIVLLKNEDMILPLDTKTKKIAVIGPNANQIYHQLGDYTSIQAENKGTTILDGIVKRSQGEVSFAQGCSVRGDSKDGFAEAIALTKEAEVALVVIGGSSARNFDITFDTNGAAIMHDNPTDMDCGEGVDVADLSLGGVQAQLIKELVKTGTPIVAILIQGRPHAIADVVEECKAVICGWYPGEEGGTAMSEIIFGEVNPSGKLPVSIPRSSAQLPIFYNYKDQGREPNYLDMDAAPLFPFGYGLSYSEFDLTNLRISQKEILSSELDNDNKIEVQIDVMNVGSVTGAEVVQLYIKDLEASTTRRVKELKAFKKVLLKPQEKQTLSLVLGKEDLSIWNNKMNFVLEPGDVKIMVGTSSVDTLESYITITN
ncbi:glycoside hydrolase family 3 N-terminal domain-containing protein [Alkalicoccobacillus plakortidis]|uniref:Glycoside hydrolase family 3 C-terminal domain-containing protein n=1 Tax=Alkalicoccobacillus plakortidis TaxID=444060 RepID=A0ABT0XPY8_9BACI|nr:glycoside hydrolase family 3 N-terminal domain-containing protein [Alkalicoccobacillus plakortidis]MCM2677971.1 glycoside hydrolase family 3 C-terminal domain-containing protein [Alkalicoccobacillus plakortidis]